MKKSANILFLFAAIAIVTSLFSCKEDTFDESIFNTDPSIDYLDKSAYTFPLDTFIKKEFLEPYNMQFMYRFEDKGSDMNKNLTPATYEKSVDLAVLTKYLWYDIYKELAGEKEVFLKKYSPRIVHVCGSKNYNASQGTVVGGDASGGVKINLYDINSLDPKDIDQLNELSLHVMHHEFTHILDQTVLHPQKFNTFSNGKYDASWANADDSLKAGIGFVTPYASASATEDWAEVIANYVTLTPDAWNRLLSSASYEWEEIDLKGGTRGDDYSKYWTKKRKAGCDYDTIGHIKDLPNGDLKLYRRLCKRDADDNVQLEPDVKTLYSGSKVINKYKTNKDGSVKVDDDGNPILDPWTIPNVDWTTVAPGYKLRVTAEVAGNADASSFALLGASENVIADNLKWDVEKVTVTLEVELTEQILADILSADRPSLSISGEGFTIKKVELAGESKVQWIHNADLDGKTIILEKVDLARKYLLDSYQLDLDELRKTVLSRTYKTDENGEFVKDANGKYVNMLMEIQPDGRTLMDNLRDMVYKYDDLRK